MLLINDNQLSFSETSIFYKRTMIEEMTLQDIQEASRGKKNNWSKTREKNNSLEHNFNNCG